ncbi:MAG: hypothetical protein K0R66_1119 [Gammaproteobacteria bacterium]|jgi:hypothetical protein|nr:hypothetical protein [Gammaproteobacteria bacterium]
MYFFERVWHEVAQALKKKTEKIEDIQWRVNDLIPEIIAKVKTIGKEMDMRTEELTHLRLATSADASGKKLLTPVLRDRISVQIHKLYGCFECPDESPEDNLRVTVSAEAEAVVRKKLENHYEAVIEIIKPVLKDITQKRQRIIDTLASYFKEFINFDIWATDYCNLRDRLIKAYRDNVDASSFKNPPSLFHFVDLEHDSVDLNEYLIYGNIDHADFIKQLNEALIGLLPSLNKYCEDYSEGDGEGKLQWVGVLKELAGQLLENKPETKEYYDWHPVKKLWVFFNFLEQLQGINKSNLNKAPHFSELINLWAERLFEVRDQVQVLARPYLKPDKGLEEVLIVDAASAGLASPSRQGSVRLSIGGMRSPAGRSFTVAPSGSAMADIPANGGAGRPGVSSATPARDGKTQVGTSLSSGGLAALVVGAPLLSPSDHSLVSPDAYLSSTGVPIC